MDTVLAFTKTDYNIPLNIPENPTPEQMKEALLEALETTDIPKIKNRPFLYDGKAEKIIGCCLIGFVGEWARRNNSWNRYNIEITVPFNYKNTYIDGIVSLNDFTDLSFADQAKVLREHYDNWRFF